MKKPAKKIKNRIAKKPGTALTVHKQEAPRSMLELIRDAARDKTIDVAKWNSLLDLQERVEARDAERAFNIAMTQAQERMPKVLKDRSNPITRSKYSTLEKVNNTIMPVAREFGFSLSFSTEPSNLPDHYREICYLSHTAGHSRTYKADVPSDSTGMKGNQNKSPAQAFGSTMSYGRRYLTLMIFNIVPTENEDDDGNNGNAEAQPITDDQFTKIEAKIVSSGADRVKFRQHFDIESIRDLPQKEFDTAMKMLEQKEARK